MDWLDNLFQLLIVFLGSLSFALFYRIQQKKLLPASLGGVLAWGAYLLAGLFLQGEVARFFIAAVVLTIYGEVMARVLKCPATVFIVTAACPLIPGRYLYETMACFTRGDYAAFSQTGLHTLLLAAALAAGMLLPMSLFQLVRRGRSLLAGHGKIQF